MRTSLTIKHFEGETLAHFDDLCSNIFPSITSLVTAQGKLWRIIGYKESHISPDGNTMWVEPATFDQASIMKLFLKE